MRWKLYGGETSFMIANHAITNEREESHITFHMYFPLLLLENLAYLTFLLREKILVATFTCLFHLYNVCPNNGALLSIMSFSDIPKIFFRQKFSRIHSILFKDRFSS